ncbi:PLP-dependent threonine dehydratase [Saccharospirillum sp. MSK14-1]|uniref:threonine ammonia-lyase, biosynthetic n=1 Tax=Saccharospirillum sp. MSK14-1 TaxID=1897632 RepID=UPI000D3D479D|nr:threonine ammonia-lyase, biosynthetic [Saccharospirillum sp. MSK14-1]PTY38819.1 PLP-dependent threonine dehydratase [Saccharospirillum sp. MSK14-1]
MLEQYVKKILNAKVYDAAIETPLEPAAFLSRRMNNQILIKREDLQSVFSFKLRGAYNKMTTLNEEQLAKGVICASAGNHAQGLAEAARLMGVKATIVMPKTTPDIKVANVRARGGKAVLVGDSFDEALAHAQKLEAEKGLTFIHPFDDPDIIAGQGTVAREILHQHRGAPIDAVFIPVGGGGLAAGMAAYIKYLQPQIKVIGVEFEESACLSAAMKAGKRVTLDQVGIFADGIAVAQIGKHGWKICKDHIDEVITVSSDEICAAVKDIFDDTRSITEPAGATSVAGMKKFVAREGWEGKTLVTISSGANTNFDRLRYVAERAEVGEHREAILSVTIPERPGAFKQFVSIIGKRAVTEFNYRYADDNEAKIFVGVKISSNEERQELVQALRDADHAVLDLTDNEVAKSHIRHMVGGHAPDIADERLYRFEFPERPGALGKFLNTLGGNWNISLFHYRNHGAAYGRVLAGIQVPKSDMKNFRTKLDELGYPYWDESENPVYSVFLG